MALKLTEVNDFYHKVYRLSHKSGFYKRYPLGVIWKINARSFIYGVINSKDSALEKLNVLQRSGTICASGESDNMTKEKIVEWWISYLSNNLSVDISKLDSNLQESEFFPFSYTYQRRKVSQDFFRYIAYISLIKKHCPLPNDKLTVFELGAGNGGFARIFKVVFLNTKYIVCDLPEVLYFSSIFLGLNFPKAKHCYITSKLELDNAIKDDSSDFIFVPAFLTENISKIKVDLFINTHSLGEMRNETIQFYMDLIQNKLDTKYFFGLNRFLNTFNPYFDRYRLQENQCSVTFDKNWKVLKWDLEPDFTRCPYLDASQPRYLNVILERERISESKYLEMKMENEKIIKDILLEDWYKFYGLRPMATVDNMIYHDLTISGTLFKLWNSVRLFPSEKNIDAIIKYITPLGKKYPFEEKYYYLELFRKITGRKYKIKINKPALNISLGRCIIFAGQYLGIDLVVITSKFVKNLMSLRITSFLAFLRIKQHRQK